MQPPVLLERHQIDDTAWNALIDRSPYATIYAYTWYLDVVSPGWTALCLFGGPTAGGAEPAYEDFASESRADSERLNLRREHGRSNQEVSESKVASERPNLRRKQDQPNQRAPSGWRFSPCRLNICHPDGALDASGRNFSTNIAPLRGGEGEDAAGRVFSTNIAPLRGGEGEDAAGRVFSTNIAPLRGGEGEDAAGRVFSTNIAPLRGGEGEDAAGRVFSTNIAPLRGGENEDKSLKTIRSSLASDYRIVMPLPMARKWGVATLRQPLFCQYLGIFSGEVLSAQEATAFLTVLGKQFTYISHYAFHPLQTTILQEVLATLPAFVLVEKSTHWLDLNKTYEKVAANYKKDRVNNLKKSQKKDWQITDSSDVGPLLSLFRKNHAPNIPGVKQYAYPLFRKLTKVILAKKEAKIQYATLGKEIHAGVMFLENNGTGIYIFNAADAAGRKGNARTYLLDNYFQQVAGTLHTFDFESPEIESIARFYESFGAEERVFISIKKNKLPFPSRQLQELRKQIIYKLSGANSP